MYDYNSLNDIGYVSSDFFPFAPNNGISFITEKSSNPFNQTKKCITSTVLHPQDQKS